MDSRPDRQSAVMGFPPSTHRYSALSGTGFAILFLVSIGIFGVDFPTYDDSGRSFASFYADNEGRVQLSVFLGALSVFSFAWFAGFMRWVLRDAERASRGFARATDIGFGAAIAAVATSMVILATQEAATVVQGSVEPGLIRALDLLGDYAFVMAALLLGMWLLTCFFVVQVTELFPRWVNVIALVGALLGIVQSTVLLAPQDDDGVLGMIGYAFIAVLLVWVTATSLLMARRLEAGPPTR